MKQNHLDLFTAEIAQLKKSNLYKEEFILDSPQDSTITLSDTKMINLCSNNYLGLANHPLILQAAADGLKSYGNGMASVRFICGTQIIHKELERNISEFLLTEDTILYSSCFDANIGLFSSLLTADDIIISDRLNHASIIDGIRLSKAKHTCYNHNDLNDLEDKLKQSEDSRLRLIVTDGVFSMEGTYANLPAIVELAKRYNAITMVDDSHAVGFIGDHGRGTPELYGLNNQIDILTGTFGKALGGASGGYVSGKKVIIEYLRQRSRPYLFSNALAPMIAAAAIQAIAIITQEPLLIKRLMHNTHYFREQLLQLGFTLNQSNHPIIPIMIGDENLTATIANLLRKEQLHVVGFSYPVVPAGQARIRVQISANHTIEQLDTAIRGLEKVGRALRIIV